MKCPYCDQEHPDSAKFCTNTGQRLEPARYCPNCADRVPPGESNCPTCGASIDSPAYPATEKTPSEEAIPPAPTAGSKPVAVTPRRKGRRFARWLACGCIGLPTGLLILLVLFIFIDPFKLHIWGRINGKYDAALEVMPADTGVYIGINALSATPAELEWISQSFTASAEPRTQPVSGFPSGMAAPTNHPSQQFTNPGDLLQQVRTATGLRIPEDLFPWIGQYGGIGLLDIHMGRSGQPVTGSWVIAIEARSSSAADEFLQTLRRNVADRRDFAFTTQTVSGISVTVHDVPADEQRLAFALSGKMVMIAQNLDGIQAMLSAQDGQSLAEDGTYQQLNALRPREWSISFYMGREPCNQLDLDEISPSIPSGLSNLLLAIPDTDAWEGVLVNGAVVATGLRLDAFTAFSPDDLSDDNLDILESLQIEPTVLQYVPDTAFLYTSGPRLDLLYQSFFDYGVTDSEAQENFQEDFDRLFGFDPEADLFDHLDGHWVLYTAPNSGGSSNALNLPFNLALLAQTSDSRAIQDTVDQLSNTLEDAFLTVDQGERGGISWNEAIGMDGTPFIFYGLEEDTFFVGSDSSVLVDSFRATSPLINQSDFLALTKYIPDELSPTFYVDLEALFDIMRDDMSRSERDAFDESIAPFQALQRFALVSALPQPDVLHTTMVVGLEQR